MRAAAEYLREQGRNVTGLVGHSKGGSGVVLYAGKYDNIPRVVNVSGRFDNQRGAQEVCLESVAMSILSLCLLCIKLLVLGTRKAGKVLHKCVG